MLPYQRLVLDGRADCEFWSTITTDVDELRLVGCTYNGQATPAGELYIQLVRAVGLSWVQNIAEFNVLDRGLFSFYGLVIVIAPAGFKCRV